MTGSKGTEQQRGISVYGMADWSQGLKPLGAGDRQSLGDSEQANRYAQEHLRKDELVLTGVFSDGKPQTFFQREGDRITQYDCVPHTGSGTAGVGNQSQSAQR